MTVTNETSYSPLYAGNGVTTNFNTTFQFNLITEIAVITVVDATGVETIVDPADYSLFSGGGGDIGTIAMDTAPATGVSLRIIRDLPFTQETDYVEATKFPASTHELALDKVTQLVQQVNGSFDRAIKLPVTSTQIPMAFPDGGSSKLGYAIRYDTTTGTTLEAVAPDVISTIPLGDKGDITVSGTGGTVWTIDNAAVTFAKMQNLSADVVLGRTGSTGSPEEITFTSFARTLADDTTASAARATLGLTIGSNVQAFNSNLTDLANTRWQSGISGVSDALNFREAPANGSQAVTIKSAASMAFSYNLTLPDTDGTAGYALYTTDGAGTLDWTPIATASFTTIAVSGQSDVVADAAADTLTFVAGANMTITTNASTDTITFASSGGGGGGLGDGDYGDIVVSGSSTVLTIDSSVISTFGRTLTDDADASAARTTLGLVIGTNVQAQDAELAAIAGLTSAADKGIQFTGSGTAATYDLTAAAKTVLDDATVAAMVNTLGGASSTGTGGLVRSISPTITGAPIIDANLYVTGQSLFVGGTTQGQLNLQEASANGADNVAILAPASLVNSYGITLPNVQGSTGQTLINSDGAGTMTWGTPAGGGGSTGSTVALMQQGNQPIVYEFKSGMPTGAFQQVSIPSNAKSVYILAFGAGGGGGSGSAQTGLTGGGTASGSGGGSGCGAILQFNSAFIPPSLYVNVGNGGAGGAAVSTSGQSNGNVGTAGGSTIIGLSPQSGDNIITLGGGGVASAAPLNGNGTAGGAAGTQTLGNFSTVCQITSIAGVAGGAGSGNNSAAAGSPTVARVSGGAGGGNAGTSTGGTNITAATITLPASSAIYASLAAPAIGVNANGTGAQTATAAASGRNLFSPTFVSNGGAGGGGAYSSTASTGTATAGAGGDGGLASGGGGGGGCAAAAAKVTGAGGRGGDGYVKIIITV
jgi:hypothetical protein